MSGDQWVQALKKYDLVLTRLFNAPRELVWKAWTDPRQFAKWWGPHGFTAPVCELDVRVGGTINVQMKGPDGSPWEKPMPMGGRFLEIVPPERLVFTTTAFPDGKGGWKLKNRNEVTLAEKGGKTELVLRVTVLKSSPEIAQALAGMEMGWSQSLEKLEALVVKKE
jgi:uncharacterized protein YndB with AHSA1/START domain